MSKSAAPPRAYLVGGGAFIVIALAYIIASQRKGYSLPGYATGMPAIWAGIFGCTGLIIGAMLIHDEPFNLSKRPTYKKALGAFQGMFLCMVLIGFISLASLHDVHGAVWSGFALVAITIPLLIRILQASKKSTGSPVVPLREEGTAETKSSNITVMTRYQQCKSCCISCSLWTSLILMTIFILAFGIGTAMTARDSLQYGPPGEYYTLSASTDSSSAKEVKIHMYCTGARASASRPLVIFEHGGGSCSFAFYGVQQALADRGIRSCAYDRPGFGWSEALPVGWESIVDYNHIITSLLTKAGEASPWIAVGHSVGVELVQILSYKNPTDVVALSLLDGYPDYLQLMGFSEAMIKASNARVCGILQAARAFEGISLTGLVQLGGNKDFQPKSEAARFTSTYTNGRNFDSQWRVFCRSQPPDNTKFLVEASGTTAYGQNPDQPQIKWPQVGSNVFVQIISASKTVLSPMIGFEDNPYYTQAQAYNQTLSPSGKSEWLIVEGEHSFPYVKTDYLADHLANLYLRV